MKNKMIAAFGLVMSLMLGASPASAEDSPYEQIPPLSMTPPSCSHQTTFLYTVPFVADRVRYDVKVETPGEYPVTYVNQHPGTYEVTVGSKVIVRVYYVEREDDEKDDVDYLGGQLYQYAPPTGCQASAQRGDHCVSDNELRRVKINFTRARVHRIFDTRGNRTDQYRRYGFAWQTRIYQSCDDESVAILYRKPVSGSVWRVAAITNTVSTNTRKARP